MGNWHLDENDKWQYDEDAPSAGPTPIRPRPSPTPAYVESFTKDDGTAYGRPSPEQFPLFDEADSTTITDDGGPPDGGDPPEAA